MYKYMYTVSKWRNGFSEILESVRYYVIRKPVVCVCDHVAD